MRDLTVFGLAMTMAGAALLFFYGLPSKTIGNVALIGSTVMVMEPKPNERAVPEAEWQPKFEALMARAAFLNRTGFALVSAGTALQLVAALVPPAH